MGANLRLVGRELLDSKQLRLQRMYPGSKWWGQTRTAQVPLPKDVSDDDLITWVLEDNASCRFYERLGGERLGSKTVEIADMSLRAIAYGWPDASVLLKPEV